MPALDRRAWLTQGLASGGALFSAPWLSGCDTPSTLLQGGFSGQDLLRGHQLRQPPEPPSSLAAQRCGVLICGGGISGLAAARTLRHAGLDDWVLLELQDQIGGNSQGSSLQGVACPLGAHYLPLPSRSAHDVQALLEELGLCRWVVGRWEYDERYLCHTPQERLYWQGGWHEGLLPTEGVSASTLAQYRQFAALIAQAQQQANFAMPTLQNVAATAPLHQQLDQQNFAHWLAAEGLDDPHLRWYLDYCCRDDFGASASAVSAWAGVHYFASRGGFSAPQTDLGDTATGMHETDNHSVLTWPQGNGWLTEQMLKRLQGYGSLQSGHSVQRITETPSHVDVMAYDHTQQRWRRWQAQHVIVALPLFLARRVVHAPPSFLLEAAQQMHYAPWLVANLHLRQPLQDRPGAAPAWDNVLFSDPVAGGLGYVDARHQSLDPRPAPTVLSYYQALGDDLSNKRQALATYDWNYWAQPILDSLQQPHPDLLEHLTHIAITRYGHAMAIPRPGNASALHQVIRQANAAPSNAVSWNGMRTACLPVAGTHRLRFAHADWAGYSVFEEAFTRGHHAALSVL